MDAGLYGVCIECGRPVGDARLAAMPTALRCMACGPTIADRGGMP
jgi:RNA polymerase-binding transcription factor DksA